MAFRPDGVITFQPAPRSTPRSRSSESAPRITSGARSSSSRVSSSLLADQLRTAGFFFPFPITDILERAIRVSNGSAETAYAVAYSSILRSKRFRSYYPGIFRSNGTLRITPAEYEQIADSYQSAAASAGLSVSRKQVGTLISRSVSGDEFAFRVKAVNQIRANGHALGSLNQILRSRGLPPVKTARAAFDFLTGASNSAVYSVYEEFAFTEAAREAGVSLSVQQARRLRGSTPEVTSLEEAREGFAKISETRDIADAELQAAGLDLDDLTAVFFKNDPKARQRVEQVLRNRQARLSGDVKTVAARDQRGRPVIADTQRTGV